MKKIICVTVVVCVTFCLVSCGGKKAKPAANEFGVITAESWKDLYPEQYASYAKNFENDFTYSYIEEHPQMLTLFKGFGYSKTYTAARGHVYTLEDVAASGRPHPRANCLSCKSADYTALVNQSSDYYREAFEDIHGKVSEPVSCYNCHENDVTAVHPTHQYLMNAVGSDSGVSNNILACAQCHVDYYFAPDTFETTLPYNSVAETHPDAMIAYYDKIGFSDWTHPDTGTKHVFIQHTEFETNMQEGSHINMGSANTCAACHMGSAKNSKGKTVTDHFWKSPFDNVEFMQNNCASCHGDVNAFKDDVEKKQESVVAYTYEVADKIVDLTNRLAQAVAAGKMTEAQLEELRTLNRHAQFYWNYVATENSNGAHNFKITQYCLDKAMEIADQALTKI